MLERGSTCQVWSGRHNPLDILFPGPQGYRGVPAGRSTNNASDLAFNIPHHRKTSSPDPFHIRCIDTKLLNSYPKIGFRLATSGAHIFAGETSDYFAVNWFSLVEAYI